jgi:hypothetical protein
MKFKMILEEKWRKEMKDSLFATIAVLIFIALDLCGSWLVTCGIIKLICICFSLTFSWGVATGIWLVMILMRSVFQNNSSK